MVVIILVVLEVPVQPFGSVQMYDAAPLTGAIEKVSIPPLQTTDWPLIAPGVGSAGTEVTASVLGVVLPQELLAVTDTVPLAPTMAIIVLVVEVPIQPPCRVHVYEVAPLTAATEKVSIAPVLHPDALLVMLPTETGAEPIVMARVCRGELPQLLTA